MADSVEIQNYTEFVERKERIIDHDVISRLISCARDLHAIVGITTEAGELADAYKKHIFRGDPLDKANVKEEIGDIAFYLTMLASAVGTTIEEAVAANMRKLDVRYKKRFTAEESINRDVVAEAAVLGDDTLGEDQ